MFEFKILHNSLDFLHLYKNGEAVVGVEVGSEGGRCGGEAVVAHGCHHPVQEHGAGSVEELCS